MEEKGEKSPTAPAPGGGGGAVGGFYPFSPLSQVLVRDGRPFGRPGVAWAQLWGGFRRRRPATMPKREKKPPPDPLAGQATAKGGITRLAARRLPSAAARARSS